MDVHHDRSRRPVPGGAREPDAAARDRDRLARPVGGWLSARADPAGLRIVVRGASADEAKARSVAVAAAFVDWSVVYAREHREAELAAAQTRVEELTERVRVAQVLGAASDADVATLLRERDDVMAARDAALALLATGPAAPLEARPDLVRSRPPPSLRDAVASGVFTLVIGLLAGLRGSATGTAATAKRRAQRHATPRPMPERARSQDVEPPDLPETLARFPSSAADDEPELRSAADGLARALVRHGGSAPVVTLIVSLGAGEGKTTVACHVAEALERSGRSTLLVDASLWSPVLATRYGVDEPATGEGRRVASTLDWMQRPGGKHQVVGVELGDGRRLDLVPQFRATRPAPGTADALFGAFGDALGRWRGYEFVVVDTAALEAVDDTTYLAPFATAAVVVVDRRLDGRRHREDARRRLRAAEVPILGFVLDEPRGERDAARGSGTVR